MKLGIYPNISKPKVVELINKIYNLSKDFEVIISQDFENQIRDINYNYGDFKDVDIIVTLGGDGTLIKAARQYAPYNIPIIGINLGYLGFLTEVNIHELQNAIEKITIGDYYVEERMMLDIKICDGHNIENYYALNDLVVTRKLVSRMINTAVYINNQYLDKYKADGIITATPTGSTAYSLSAGGPIVDPQMKLIIITPVCPHSLHSRSIIASNDKIISIVPEVNYDDEIIATVDGQISVDIKPGMKIEVTQSKYTTKLVKFSNYNFYDTIQKKLFVR